MGVVTQFQLKMGLTPQQHRSLAFLYGFDFGSALLAQDAYALWMLGYPDQAVQRSHEALALAEGLDHPFSLGRAVFFAAMLHLFRREGRATQERAEAAIRLSTEQGFAFWLAWGTILRGWASTEQGQVEEGIAQMPQGLTASRATGGVNVTTLALASLAEAHGKAGHTEEGLSVLAETLAVVDQTEERFWEAEIHRLKGELLRSQAIPDEQQAETCFHQALNIARHQQAKSLELRVAVSLSRLLQRQGKPDEARQMLAEIYGWFTEGFDTADLKEAKGLLEELS